MKIVLKIILSIIILAISFVVAMQGVTKIYRNPTSQQFRGTSLYNPYAGIDSARWNNGFVKANFHAHTRWDVNGTYTVEEFEQAYLYSKYQIITVSDHNTITRDLQGRPWFIQTYEHGWNINNFHILMLDAPQEDLLDYPIMFLPRQQMQYAIERLAGQAGAISINHPERVRAVDDDCFSELRGFSLMEINPDAQTIYWDKSLTAGNYVTLVASDDAHSIVNRNSWFQRAFTMVCPATLNRASIIEALQKGAAYAVTVSNERNMEGPHTDMAQLKNLSLNGDTINITLSEQAEQISFITDGGITATTFQNTPKATYVIPPSASYVRVTAQMSRGIKILLNPIARVQEPGQSPAMLPIPESVSWLTALNTVGWSVAALIVLLFLIPLWKRKKNGRKKRINFEDMMWGAGQKSYDPL